jgi:hypothetical protein
LLSRAKPSSLKRVPTRFLEVDRHAL